MIELEHTQLERETAEQEAGLLPFKAVRSNVPEENLRKSRAEGDLEIGSVLTELADQDNTVM